MEELMVVEPPTQQTPVYKQEQNPREIQQETLKTNRKCEMQITDIQGSAAENNYMMLHLLFWEKL